MTSLKMNDVESRDKYLLILSIAGLGIAVLSALETHVTWLASFCGIFGEGCRETAMFKLMGVSVWFWGVAYYVALIGAVLFFRRAVFWLVMTGLGVEIGFLWIIFSQKLICIFCLLNAVVMFLLVVLSFRQDRIWQMVAVSLLAFVPTNALLSKDHMPIAQGWQETSGDAVVARVGDETISVRDLESPLATRIYQLQQEIYRMKRDRLEILLDDILLRKVAEQKGVTVDQLFESAISKEISVSDEEVENYYQQNLPRWTNWPGTREDLKSRIRIFLEQQKTRQAIKNQVQPLREQYPVTVHLDEPPLPFSKVSVGDSPVSGPPDAAVTVVEFSDYLCPACRNAHETTKTIRKTYAGKVRWIFKDYPLDIHKGARKLAEAAHCAGEQGRFWEYQDHLFSASGEIGPAKLKEFATQLGLDGDRFMRCFESREYAAQVDNDIKQAGESGVSSTPSFIINGRLKPGSLSPEDFKQIIDEELTKAGLTR